MTPIEFANKYGMKVVTTGCGNERQIEGVYCGDLLSMVMGRAKENDVFVTVMANVNTVAVAVLADVACILLCEGVHFDEMSTARAEQQEVCVIESDEPAFSIALKLGKELGLC
jgi:S-adenosylhomocysteine hydrolase